ncbi:MAG: septation protein A [Woeseiaceae bacterium]
MQLLIDFLPIVLFFATYVFTKKLLVAVAVLMVVAPIAFIAQWFLTRKINKMSAASTALVVVLGGATLISGDSVFIYWKPTVLYWAASIAFLASQYVGEKPFIQRMMQAASKDDDDGIQLSPQNWNTLNFLWVIFFIVAGAINIYVAYNYEESTWVNFKLFGLLGMTFVFIVAQSFWLARHIESDDPE